MALLRLRPASISTRRPVHLGRCAACEDPIALRDEAIHIYGESFHADCAFYRTLSREQRSGSG